MTTAEKLNILEDLLDIEKDTLTEDTELNQISEWDSIAVISIIAMFDSVWEDLTLHRKKLRNLKL